MAQDPPPDPALVGDTISLDNTGLCLLSLDGGGVRGLSTLYILRSIMKQVNEKRSAQGLSNVKPCDLFDLIGGTSTGGLIAIMLGRLEMDVDECIAAYIRLNEEIFRKRLRRIPLGLSGRLKARFDSETLRDAIVDVIVQRGFTPSTLLNDGQPQKCRVFVCTAAKDLYGIKRIRSYNLPGISSISATICEAALATSAASGFFDPASIEGRQYIDGALGANNPVEEVELEATDIWCSGSREVKHLVKCFISLGTGSKAMAPVSDNILKFVKETLTRIATQTDDTARRFLGRWGQQFTDNRYFRFNVDHGLEKVGLDEYKERATIETATEQYLNEHELNKRVVFCAHNLEAKRNKTPYGFKPTIANQPQSTNAHIGQKSSRAFEVPFHRNSKFTGRHTVIETLKAQLFTPAGHQDCALTGLGGIGKTQIALQLAFWVKETKPEYSVFWVSALSSTTFRQGYAQIAKLLGCHKTEKENDDMDLVKQTLSSDPAGKWFLIVDNADDISILHGTPDEAGGYGSPNETSGYARYLPHSDLGLTLFTTRFREVANSVGADIVDLPGMEKAEATDLLKNLLPKQTLGDDDTRLVELLEKLTYLPLAITQAAAYIKTKCTSVEKYLQLLQGTEKDVTGLLSREFVDNTRYRESRHAVLSTWLVSFRTIRSSDPDAHNFLTFISCIEPKGIPQSILPYLDSEEATISAIGTLKAYSFLVEREESGVFDMHSLVHRATTDWVQRENISEEVKQKAVTHVAEIFPWCDHKNQDLWRAYLPHAFQILRDDKKLDWRETSNLRLSMGTCLVWDGRISEAVLCLEECYQARKSRLEPQNLDLLEAGFWLCSTYQRHGQIKHGIQLMESIVVATEDTLPEDDTSRLRCTKSLGLLYLDDGQVARGIRMLESVVEVRKQTLSETHPHRLASIHELASAYLADQQVEKAISLLEEVVKIEKQNLSETHPNRLTSIYALAYAYLADQQVEKAISLLEEVVEIEKQTLSETHPDRLASIHALASAYLADQQVEKAISLHEEVVKIRKQTLSETHPGRLKSIHELASAYLADQQVEKAISLLEEVVKIRKQTLSETHPHRLASIHELARAYLADQQVEKAISLHEEVVKIRKQTLSETHPGRLKSIHALASAYLADQQVEKAISLLEEVVKIRKQTLSETHPHRLASIHELARAYLADQQVDKAISLLEEVVKIRNQTLSETHPDRLVSMHNLATCYWGLSQADKAIQLMTEVVEKERLVLDKSHPDRQISEAWLQDMKDEMARRESQSYLGDADPEPNADVAFTPTQRGQVDDSGPRLP